MGAWSRTLLVACALVAGPVTGAAAADFRYPPQPVVAVPSAVPIPDYSAWYLRGDIGFAFNEDPDMSRSGTAFTGTGMDDIWSIGGGFGYNFRDNIRGDITIDYRLDTDVTGTNPVTATRSVAELNSTVALANLYYDFRGRDHFSPYVGAGLGFTLNEIDEKNGATLEDDNIDLAGALMAGFSYRFGDEWLFDAGYRFLYLGEAQTESTATTGALGVEDIYSHELRIGFRYELN
jgi:opacity protein-like surface antigen